MNGKLTQQLGPAAIVLFGFAVRAVVGEEPAGKEPASGNAAVAAKFAAAEAVRYDIRPRKPDADKPDESDGPLKLRPQPVLRWSNPTGGEVHGSVVLWTRQGCPAAAASIYQFFDRKQLNVELVSLSEESLEGKRNERLRWTPEPGLTFKALPKAPAAGDTPQKRQSQMRTLARRFAGGLADRGDDETLSVLRLMDRPLHQYASDEKGREGAVFAFVSTTDPEILLLLESRMTSSGREWLYAAARMHFCRVQLKLDGTPVWDLKRVAPPWDRIRGPEGTYIILEWPSAEAAAADRQELEPARSQ